MIQHLDFRYEIMPTGAIRQIDPQPFQYDENYVATYDSKAYKSGSAKLQALRLGFVIGAHGLIPDSILDVGYGNGDFMLAARKLIPRVYGKDVTGKDVTGCVIVDQYVNAAVVTFWDVLEHIPDHSFLSDLSTSTIVLSLPWCHYSTHGIDWFTREYHHLKPNEHIWHFSPGALSRHMAQYGWHTVSFSHHEDLVRRGKNCLPNIISMAFKRK